MINWQPFISEVEKHFSAKRTSTYQLENYIFSRKKVRYFISNYVNFNGTNQFATGTGWFLKVATHLFIWFYLKIKQNKSSSFIVDSKIETFVCMNEINPQKSSGYWC